MKEDARRNREAQIEDAAYRILDAKGLDGLTMQALAKEARASMETLYRWYGERTGLFASLVGRNASDLIAALDDGDPDAHPALTRLQAIGPRLLTMVLGERAISLNRAAAGDSTGALGRALAEQGRQAVGPLISRLIQQAVAEGALGSGDPTEQAETYIALLIGELQIRRATHAMAKPLDDDAIQARANRALAQLTALYPPRSGPATTKALGLGTEG